MGSSGEQAFAETWWDRESTVWRVRVNGELMRGAQGNVLAWGGFNDAYDAAQRVNTADRTEQPSGCAECDRLRTQARAAVLTGDHSRLTDVRVLQRRHTQAEHAKAATTAA